MWKWCLLKLKPLIIRITVKPWATGSVMPNRGCRTTIRKCCWFFLINAALWPSRQQSVHLLHQSPASSARSVGLIFAAWRAAVLRLTSREERRRYIGQVRWRWWVKEEWLVTNWCLTLWTRRSLAPAIIAARPVWAGGSSPWLPPPMGSGGGKGGWGAPAEGGGGPGGGGGGGGPPMFIGGGTTGGATESTAGCPWKGEPAGGDADSSGHLPENVMFCKR